MSPSDTTLYSSAEVLGLLKLPFGLPAIGLWSLLRAWAAHHQTTWIPHEAIELFATDKSANELVRLLVTHDLICEDKQTNDKGKAITRFAFPDRWQP